MKTEQEVYKAMIESLAYDPETGLFSRIKSRGSRKPGARVGCGSSSNGYLATMIYGKSYLLHRLAWLFVYGKWPMHKVDHINGDKRDNRIANLRDVPHKLNMENRRRAHQNSRSGFLGVYPEGKRWSARIAVDGKRVSLGTYDNPEKAHSVYLAAKRKFHQGCSI